VRLGATAGHMSVREFINKHRGASAAIIGVAIASSIALSIWLRSREVSQFGPDQEKAWFTVDDGKTYFAAPQTNSSPQEANGKTAYRCFVFKCPDRPQPFVAYLERDQVAPPSQAQVPGRPRPQIGKPGARGTPGGGLEVKAPGTGAKGWVGMYSGDGLKLVNVRCADRTQAKPVSP
jgi:hypothetical protein